MRRDFTLPNPIRRCLRCTSCYDASGGRGGDLEALYEYGYLITLLRIIRGSSSWGPLQGDIQEWDGWRHRAIPTRSLLVESRPRAVSLGQNRTQQQHSVTQDCLTPAPPASHGSDKRWGGETKITRLAIRLRGKKDMAVRPNKRAAWPVRETGELIWRDASCGWLRRMASSWFQTTTTYRLTFEAADRGRDGRVISDTCVALNSGKPHQLALTVTREKADPGGSY